VGSCRNCLTFVDFHAVFVDCVGEGFVAALLLDPLDFDVCLPGLPAYVFVETAKLVSFGADGDVRLVAFLLGGLQLLVEVFYPVLR
jgi:hypothetical protein